MSAFLIKNHNEILAQALDKVKKTTPVTATSPGSVMRALTEAITREIGDLYQVVDFNMSLNMVSTAQGRALDLMGSLYNVERKTLSTMQSEAASKGSFYFYIDEPAPENIIIPAGTLISTDNTVLIGRVFTYELAQPVMIPTGRTRAYGVIRPRFSDSVYTAGAHTLTVNSFTDAPLGIVVRCTNPKPIQAQVGYEDDDSYRLRIIKQVRSSVGGTAESLRFAALGISGVRDAKIREALYGLGTFDIIVVIDNRVAASNVLNQVRGAIQSIRPVGVFFDIREPTKVPMDIEVSIVVRTDTAIDRNIVVDRAKVSILRYLNTMLIGTPLVYNQLIQSIMESTMDIVLDVTVTKYAVNGQEVIRRNFIPNADEMIVPGSVQVSITTI